MQVKMKKIYSLIIVALALLSVTGCKEDDNFTESIFDTDIAVVDEKSDTAPFDQWLYDNFVQPYNTEIQYKFNYNASKMDYQLTPADYYKSQLLAHFVRYLFYDVYDKCGGASFMRTYAPRILHFIGSSAYSPTTGTETLGYASAGVKITIINVNSMKTVEAGMTFTSDDLAYLNEKIFHTMHHEFSHILHQNKSYPVAFSQITPDSYDGRTWQDRDSTDSHSLGFITQYGSSGAYEDFVETLSCSITDTDGRWMNCLIDATLNGGVKNGDKEQVYALIDSLGITNLDDPNQHWNNFSIYKELEKNDETGAYEESGRYILDAHLTDAKTQASAADRTTRYELETSFTSFRDYLDNWVPISSTGESSGINAILKKIETASKWYTETFDLHLFRVRAEVRYRQEHINEYINSDQCVIYSLDKKN